MPRRRRSLKTIVVEAFFVVVFLTIVGHLSVSFWESYFIQSELTHVKGSLDTLKKTLANIGNAYDNLYRELPRALPIPTLTTDIEHKLRNKYTLNRYDDVKEHSAQISQKVKIDNPGILKQYYIENAATQSAPEKDATTITRNLLKATAVEADLSHENCRHHKHCHKNSEQDEHCAYNYRITDNLKV